MSVNQPGVTEVAPFRNVLVFEVTLAEIIQQGKSLGFFKPYVFKDGALYKRGKRVFVFDERVFDFIWRYYGVDFLEGVSFYQHVNYGLVFRIRKPILTEGQRE